MSDQKNKQQNRSVKEYWNSLSKWAKRAVVSIIVSALLIIIAFAIGRKSTESPQNETFVDKAHLQKVCEWTLIKAYYHNVASRKKKPGTLFQYGWLDYGYKKYFIEYDGIVNIGIDVDKVNISEPDKAGNIKVFIPKARVIDVEPVNDSIRVPIEDEGAFTESLSGEEQSQVFAEAQKNMEEAAKEDTLILEATDARARSLIEQYIKSFGLLQGKSWTVTWVDKPEDAKAKEKTDE